MKERGSGLVLFLIGLLVLMILPILQMSIQRAMIQNRLNTRESMNKSAKGLAANVLYDYIRQFTQDPYLDYNNVEQFQRPEMFFGVGYSSVTVSLDPGTHSLYVNALGKYGSDASTPLAERRLDAVFQFYSDITHYMMVFDTANIGGTNTTYGGGIYAKSFTLSGTNAVIQGGPLVVETNITLQPTTIVNADIFVGGTLTTNGATINGTVYPFAPPALLESISMEHYLVHNNLLVSNINNPWPVLPATPVVWTFGCVGNQGYFNDGTSDYFFPGNRAVIAAQDSHIVARGTLCGHVTLAVSGTGNNGQVTFENSFQYGTNPNQANANDSFAVIVSQFVNQRKVTDDGGLPLQFSGMILSLDTAVDAWGNRTALYRYADLFPAVSYNFTGTRTGAFVDSPGVAPSFILSDPGLVNYPPPGLPERAILCTYRKR